MRIPLSTADVTPETKIETPGENQAYIKNPYVKAMLTRSEALNAINLLSGMLLIDVNLRRCEQSNQEHRTDIPAS